MRCGRLRGRWEDNIEVDHGEISCGDRKWKVLAQDNGVNDF
jgi:hypothetical protein